MTKGKQIVLTDAKIQHSSKVFSGTEISSVDVSIDKDTLSLVFRDEEPVCSVTLKATNLFRTILHAFLEQVKTQPDLFTGVMAMVGEFSIDFSYDPEEDQDIAVLTLEQFDEESQFNEEQTEILLSIENLLTIARELDKAFKAKMVN